jgi:transposase
VKIDNCRFLDALIYICENGCKWRALPGTFGPWHTIYVRINRWAKNGVLERIFHALQEEPISRIEISKRVKLAMPTVMRIVDELGVTGTAGELE